MNKLKLIFINFIFCTHLIGQDSSLECNCKAYLVESEIREDQFNQDFHKQYNKILKENNESCNDLKILKDSADFFYIQPFYDIPNHSDKKYRIKKSNPFFVNPLSGDTNYFYLFEYHNKNSIKLFSCKYGYDKNQINQVNTRLKVVGCYKDWIKVTVIFQGREYTGWTNNYCPLSCTTCN